MKMILRLLFPLVLATGCSDDDRLVQRLTAEDLVITNCHTVRDSADRYARETGAYPTSFRRDWLQNPFTGKLTQPVSSRLAEDPGETGYASYWNGGKYAGYVITGFGKTGEIFRLYANYPDSLHGLDSLVMANCYVVQAAAEAFAVENGGVYADDLGGDATAAGNTVVDFLPGGALFENPYTHALTEPVDGAAASPGETGYADIKDASGTQVGYKITAHGAGWVVFTIENQGTREIVLRSAARGGQCERIASPCRRTERRSCRYRCRTIASDNLHGATRGSAATGS